VLSIPCPAKLVLYVLVYSECAGRLGSLPSISIYIALWKKLPDSRVCLDCGCRTQHEGSFQRGGLDGAL